MFLFGNSSTKYFSSKWTLFRGYSLCQSDSFSLLWLLFFFPQDWISILWLLQTACLTCQSCSVAACHSLLSWLLSYFHFSAFHLSVHCFLPHLIHFFWAFLILFGPFPWVGSDTVVSLGYFSASLQISSLADWSSILQSLDVTAVVQPHGFHCWVWAGVGAASWLFLLTNCSLEHVGRSFCPVCPCKSGQDWSFLIYMFSMKHKSRLGHQWGSQTLMAGRFLLECHSLHLRWWNRNWCLKGWIHSLRDLPGWVCCLSCFLLSLSSEFWETHLCFSTWGSCDTAGLGDAWNAGETSSPPLPFCLFDLLLYLLWMPCLLTQFVFDFCVVLKLLRVSLLMRALHTTPGLCLWSGLVKNSQICYRMAKIGIS